MPKIYNTIIANFKRTYLRAEAEKAEKRRRTFVLVMEKIVPRLMQCSLVQRRF